MLIPHDRLKSLTTAIFSAAGCEPDEAARVAHYLVQSNLVGHDSHGVIRIPTYVDFLKTGKVIAGRKLKVILENEAIAVVDGEFGLGQSVGEQATRLGIEKSRQYGVSVIALRNSGHLGRIGDFPLMAAREGLLSLHWVNTSGAGILVAPFGGLERRLSACPIAAGVPIENGPHMVLDMSGCMIAEGKVRVARNQGVPVPDGCLIDAQGQPTNDPNVFYGDPPGAILPIAGHKGSGLTMIAEMLGGALTGSQCSNPKNADRVVNGMLSIYLDRKFFLSSEDFSSEVNRFIAWVKTSKTTTAEGEILMPGEIEERTQTHRLANGIKIDETTLQQIEEKCEMLGVTMSEYV